MKKLTLFAAIMALIGCSKQTSFIAKETVANLQQTILEKHPDLDTLLVQKGIEQAAALWTKEDGTEAEFVAFAQENIAPTQADRKILFNKLSTALEALNGTANMLTVKLQKPMHLVGDPLTNIDYIFGAYTPFAHLSDDLFANKVAFLTIINFPNFTLAEKDALGKDWTREEWAFARMGDVFTSRVPAEILQQQSEVYTEAENYIAAYNIMMGHVLTEDGERLWPEEMCLLSHWNLRDELKSNYADVPHASEKQEMIYRIMEHIIRQTIPAQVVNNPAYDWNPVANTVFADGKEVPAEPTNARYEQLLNVYHADRAIDAYSPALPTALERNFEGTMEVSQARIEELFTTLISSPEVARVADMIRMRLGRELRPYDIWYDGFKSRSTMAEDDLTALTRKRYPNAEAFEKDMPRMLQVLGFDKEDSYYLADKIVVEAARGSGHAWGAQGRWEPARLRTRIAPTGMDYKGYNIAVHEFGHNVEQTLDLYDIDYYTLAGVPNTAFTEALAFMFQKRDLQLLGYPHQMSDNTVLDIFWSAYEIMGVALVDMKTWQWLYAHPQATAGQLREATIKVAQEVWNQYYEPNLGTHDSPILAVYSHMINSPLYLANYPFGNLIEFQLEEYLANLPEKDKGLLPLRRIYTLGRLTPDAWMVEAVGSPVSVEPLIKATAAVMDKK